jgi:hypothetical protein
MTLYDVEYDTLDPLLGTVDLTRFEQLPESERMRIIIRVLCGLVAMEEVAAEPAPATAPTTVDAPADPFSDALTEALALASPDAPLAAPTPGPAPTLPVLGIEHDARHKRRIRPRGWNTALLPFVGPERAF